MSVRYKTEEYFSTSATSGGTAFSLFGNIDIQNFESLAIAVQSKTGHNVTVTAIHSEVSIGKQYETATDALIWNSSSDILPLTTSLATAATVMSDGEPNYHRFLRIMTTLSSSLAAGNLRLVIGGELRS